MAEHDVRKLGNNLDRSSIAVLVSGGIAAYKVLSLIRLLRQYGADVRVYATPAALDYVTKRSLEWCSGNPVITELSHRSEHLFSYDAYLLAPGTHNTISKFAVGIGDNAVSTTLISALGRLEKKDSVILMAPAMHTSMMNSVYHENIRKLLRKGVCLIEPHIDMGKAKLPDIKTIAARTIRHMSKSSLKGCTVLVTAGPIPGWIDNVRMLTNRFSGRTGIKIADEAYLRGADVTLVLGKTELQPPGYLNTIKVQDIDQYRKAVLNKGFDIGIYTAAVADYIPKTTRKGKIPSDAGLTSISLKTTPKIIQEIRETHPSQFMVAFKYQEGLSVDELLKIARQKAETYDLVIANRGEDIHGSVHRSFFVKDQKVIAEPSEKQAMAETLMDFLEKQGLNDSF